ncbi:SigE family RNA polymerase sigma factor [soil metagenome]
MIDTTARDSAVPGARAGAGVGTEVTTPGFDDFVAARSTALLRTAYLLTHDHGLAEDLLQTSLTKAWFAWSRISDSPEAYVRKVLFNTYATWWRRKWNGEQATEELPERGVDDAADDTGTGIDLWSAMERLPRRQRAVVVLRYFEDLTEPQTAELLGCSVGTVKSQCSKALAKLRIDPALATDPIIGSLDPDPGTTKDAS